MHTSPKEEGQEVQFWNDLRFFLELKIQVNYFDKIEDAGNLVVTPHLIRDYKPAGLFPKVRQINEQILKSNRQIITFTGGPEYTPLKGETVFSASAYKTTNDCICTPLWLFDRGYMPQIPKPKVPSAAFIAQAFYPGRLSNFVGALPTPISVENILACHESFNRLIPLNVSQTIARMVRQRVYKALKKTKDIEVEIKIRKKGFFSHTPAEREILQKEYLDSIRNNIYNICVRGDANCIFQIYDFMSAGRIPIFVDTNSQLPALKGMNWEDFCVFVPFDDVYNIADYILDFHHKHTERQLWEKLALARKAYEQLLPLAFFQENVMPVLEAINVGSNNSYINEKF